MAGERGVASWQPVPLALVHHANQYLISDGYTNRDGLAEIVAGYRAVLRLHQRYAVPLNLHLSGTLIEALAWFDPPFLAWLRLLTRQGLVTWIGGTYAEPIMTVFSPAFNRRQLEELFWLYGHHLHVAPEDLSICWIPERVWDTDQLAAVLTDPQLANGGYRRVLLDDRLLFPTTCPSGDDPRATFDRRGPYTLDGCRGATDLGVDGALSPADTYRSYRIARADGLVLVPISAHLRYWVPPASAQALGRLDALVETVGRVELPERLLVYADDLEKTAGVGGWDRRALRRYDRFLRWVRRQPRLLPIHLSTWLDSAGQFDEREIESGTYFELARRWKAGEDYRGWWDDPAWSPSRSHLVSAYEAVHQAEEAAVDARLLALAWKHLLAAAYETGWHDVSPTGCQPTPWVRAMASHARACLVVVAAAAWFAQPSRHLGVEIRDIDADGEPEVILRSHVFYAVLTPRHGGRLIYLFAQTPRGAALMVGNPTDDWNFQEELNRFMDLPANHPGAFSDVGFEHDCYEVERLVETDDSARVELVNRTSGSRLYGSRKHVSLLTTPAVLVVDYHLAPQSPPISIEVCLSPDYARLLRFGRHGLRFHQGHDWHGISNAGALIWLGRDPDEGTDWELPRPGVVGHGQILRVRATLAAFRLLVGCQWLDDDAYTELRQQTRSLLARSSARAGGDMPRPRVLMRSSEETE